MIRDFCIQQFPFIAEDFDALTTYELLAKVICYLKELQAYTKELAEKFNQLVEYVDNFIDNLDIEGILNDIIEAMYEDGRLADLVTNKLNKLIYVNNWGAKGDGETDDTEAIQYCIDNAGDGTYIFYGNYIVSNTIQLKGNTYLFGGARFTWAGDSNKAMFEIKSGTGETKPIIRGGRINGDNVLDYGVDVNPYHVLIDGLYTVNIRKAHIRIGTTGTTASSQTMITNCTLQNVIDASSIKNVGGSDISSAIGIEINHNDNMIVNTNILNMHEAVRILYSGNIFTNCHFTAAFTNKGETLKPCKAVNITTERYNTWYFNTFNNCYFDNWETMFNVENSNNNTSRQRIEVIGGVYFNSGNQFTSTGMVDAYMLKGDCPMTVKGLAQTGTPRCCLRDPFAYIGRTRLYNELTTFEFDGYARDYVHEDLVDMIGDASLLADGKTSFVDYGTLPANRVQELGIACAYNFSTYQQLNGMTFEVNDRTHINGIYKLIVSADGTMTVSPIWEYSTFSYTLCVYGLGITYIDGLPCIYFKIGICNDSNTDIETFYLSVKITPVEANKQHVYLNNKAYSKVITIPEDVVKFRIN